MNTGLSYKLVKALEPLETDMRTMYLYDPCQICGVELKDDEIIESINEKTLPHCKKHCAELKKQMNEFMESMKEYGA